jgi:hypothetical protein
MAVDQRLVCRRDVRERVLEGPQSYAGKGAIRYAW